MAELPILFHWFAETVQIIQHLFIVVIAAFIAIRINSLRQALRGSDLKWQYQLVAIVLFSLFAIFGTHSAVIIDMLDSDWPLHLNREIPDTLEHFQAIVSFRDTMALVAGFIGGPVVGLVTGSLAGAERYQLGGFAALSGAIGSVVAGLYAGLIRHFKVNWLNTASGVFWLVLLASIIHTVIILMLIQPFEIAKILASEVLVPESIVNCLGCLLFFWIMRDLDREHLQHIAQSAQLLAVQAELRALRAQVDPHFLNNTLNDLNALIRINPDQARHYVHELANFFKYTRQYADLQTISLADELNQLRRYLALQRLGLADKLHESYSIPDSLYSVAVLPGCLLTLAENAMKHAFKGRPSPYNLHIQAEQLGNNLLLKVSDNGHGINPDRLAQLGKQAIASVDGCGVALYQLQQSLDLAFGEPIQLSFTNHKDQGMTVSLLLPIRRLSNVS